MKQNKQKEKNLLLITGLAVLVLIAACSSESPSDKAKNLNVKKFDNTVTAMSGPVTRFYEAVGTIRPETEASIEAQIRAQIKKMLVAPGTQVVKGQALIRLDDLQYTSMLDRAKEGLRSATARREQAKQGLAASKAALAQADAAFKRTKKFFASQAATKQQLESAESAWKQARAGERNAAQALNGAVSGIKQAEELVKQAEITLGYTVIKAPADGVVLKKTAEVGDIALPGRPLLLVRTNSLLRIEASVREGLISNIVVGQKLDVEIKNLKVTVKAVVDEIEPFADPQTRTFLVKAALPEIKGIYPGMYGKLLIPEKTEEAVTLTPEAIRTVGQLQYVNVQEKEKWQRRFITTGAMVGNTIEVLSGLNGNETIGY